MIVFRPTEAFIPSIEALVQAWILADRLGRRLLIDWPTLPVTSQFNFGAVSSHTALTNYSDYPYPLEKDPRILKYYHQRLYTEVFALKPPLAFRGRRIILWGDAAIAYRPAIERKTRCQRFKQILEIPSSSITESWDQLQLVRQAQLVVGAESPFLRLVQLGTHRQELIIPPS